MAAIRLNARSLADGEMCPDRKKSQRSASARPAAEVGQYRVRFPERQLAIGEHRNTAVGVERKELGLAVFALSQIDGDDLAFEPQLEQRETDLLRIG